MWRSLIVLGWKVGVHQTVPPPGFHVEPVIPEPPRFTVEGHTVLPIRGVLDHHIAPNYRAIVDSHVSNGRTRFALDMDGIEGLNSIGLEVVLATWARVRAAGGDIVMCRPRPEVRKMLEMSGVSHVVEIREVSVEVGEDTTAREST